MEILIRITKIAWQFRARLILAYLSFLAAIGVSLLIPQLFGEAIDLLVAVDTDGVTGNPVSTSTLMIDIKVPPQTECSRFPPRTAQLIEKPGLS